MTELWEELDALRARLQAVEQEPRVLPACSWCKVLAKALATVEAERDALKAQLEDVEFLLVGLGVVKERGSEVTR